MRIHSVILIFFCLNLISCRDNSHRQIDKSNSQDIVFGSNIYTQDYDEQTGWIRILLNDPDFWGYIDQDSTIRIPFEYEFLNPFDTKGMALAKANGKEGFINTLGDTVIPFIYEDLSVFNNELARAKLDGKHGFINRMGGIEIPLTYEKAHSFINCGVAQVSRNGKWGFIGVKGKVILPEIYSDVDYHMNDSLLFAKKKNKWAIFDHEGTQKSGFIYDEIYGTSNNFDYFDEDFLFNQLLLVRKGNQFSYLDRDIKTVIDFGVYSKAEPISKHGFAIVKKGNQYGIINSKGKLEVPLSNSILEHPKKKYQGYYDEIFVRKNGKVGVLNNNVKLIIDIDYDSFQRDYGEIDGRYEALFVAKKDNFFGLFNKDGELLMPLEYDEINLFEGEAITTAKLKGKYGLINSLGEEVLDFRFDDISDHENAGYLICNENSNYGVLDNKTFEILLSFEYKYIENCHYDPVKFIAKRGDKFGVIDIKGNEIIPFIYDEISNWVEYGPEEHFVVKDGKKGLISREGEIVIKPIYDDLFVDNSFLIKVEKNGLFGTINWENEVIHPIEFEQILWEWPYLTGEPLDTVYVGKDGNYFATDIKGKVIAKRVSRDIIDEKFGNLINKQVN